MRRSIRSRVTRGIGVLVTVLAAFAVGPVAPAAAEGPTVVVTPDVVHDGDPIDVDISGFPTGTSGLVICTAAAAESNELVTSGCGLLSFLTQDSVPPAHVHLGVRATFGALDGSQVLSCAVVPGGCRVGVVTLAEPLGTVILAKAFDTLTFLPTLSGTPTRLLTDGATVAVSGTATPPGAWTLTQCGRAYLDDPTPAQAAALCGPSIPVTADADAVVAADVVVHDPLVPTGGGSVPCAHGGCVVVLADAATPVGASVPLSFGPPTFTVDPSSDVIDGAPVTLTVTGAPASSHYGTCVLPTAATLSASQCGEIGPFPTDASGSGSLSVVARATLRLAGTVTVDCRVTTCGAGLFDVQGNRLAEAGPLQFAPPAEVSVAPATGLLDGQSMTVSGVHIVPGDHTLRHCRGVSCDAGQPVSVGPAGSLTATLPAVQRFAATNGRHVLCRTACSVTLSSATGAGVMTGYAMAAGTVDVAPHDGLGDGQAVQVTGSDLMPTYAGPTVLFPTGGWALTQCDAAVLGNPSLLGVFTHCSVPPTTRPVDVTGATLDTTFPVASTVTKILGGTTDCTTGPGACVVGLVRFEQDATVSHHLVPVDFAG